MPPKRQQDPPSHYIAVADIPAPYSGESGRMPEFAFRAGDRVPAHRVGGSVPRDLVRDPREAPEPEPAPERREAPKPQAAPKSQAAPEPQAALTGPDADTERGRRMPAEHTEE